MEKELVSPPTGAVIWAVICGIIVIGALAFLLYKLLSSKKGKSGNAKTLFLILPILLLLIGGCAQKSEDVEPATTESLIAEFNLEKAENVKSENTNFLVFKDETEAKKFLNFVKDDYRKVGEYLKKHPEVYERSFAYNNKNRANTTDKRVNSTYNDYPPSDLFMELLKVVFASLILHI